MFYNLFCFFTLSSSFFLLMAETVQFLSHSIGDYPWQGVAINTTTMMFIETQGAHKHTHSLTLIPFLGVSIVCPCCHLHHLRCAWKMIKIPPQRAMNHERHWTTEAPIYFMPLQFIEVSLHSPGFFCSSLCLLCLVAAKISFHESHLLLMLLLLLFCFVVTFLSYSFIFPFVGYKKWQVNCKGSRMEF